ncbi:MAG: hypothetical protein AAF632_11050 [Bacteroidota bacterium]
MKKNAILAIILVVSLLACSDDEDPTAPPSGEIGKATLTLNDKPLDFTVSAGSDQCDSKNLEITLYRPGKKIRQGTSFFLGNIPAKEGKYTLRRSDTQDEVCTLETPFGTALTEDGITLMQWYEILEDKGPNELVITRYDSEAKRLEGSLQMTLAVADTLSPFSRVEHPDTLRITKGIFTATISPSDD